MDLIQETPLPTNFCSLDDSLEDLVVELDKVRTYMYQIRIKSSKH